MEVHPPEHGIHSFHDFLVHMATITLGLLIAIGLEQSVEWFHHRHQLHELREGLKEDTEKAIRDSEHIETRARVSIEWLDQREAEVQQALRHSKSIADLASVRHVEIDLPGAPSWRAAKNGGLLQIVSQRDIQAYSEVDDLIVQDDAAYVKGADIVSKRMAFEKQFSTDDTSGHHDFTSAVRPRLNFKNICVCSKRKRWLIAGGVPGLIKFMVRRLQFLMESAIWTRFRQRKDENTGSSDCKPRKLGSAGAVYADTHLALDSR